MERRDSPRAAEGVDSEPTDMRKLLRAMLRALGLEKFLVLLVAGIVAIAVALVAGASVSRLERIAREQGLARVQLAGVTALGSVHRLGDDVLVAARLLAERPTLRRLVETGDTAGLEPFLGRFEKTSGLSACAVLRHDAVVARSGVPMSWAAFALGQGAHEGRFLASADSVGPLVLGASASVPGVDGATVFAARLLDEVTIRAIAAEADLATEILPRAAALHASSDPRGALRRQAIEWEETQAAFLPGAQAFVVDAPLRTSGGEIVGIVESSLPSRDVSAPVVRFTQWLALVSIAVALAGAFFGALIARRLVAPVERLTLASARIGRGDLVTPIPRTAGREVGELASTMEEMRTKLLRLMAELGRRRAEADAILGGIAEGVFSVDGQRRIRYMNPQTAALLGITPESAMGRFCGDVLRPVDASGNRPCEENCPIVHARFRGSATATEHLVTKMGGRRTVVITSAAPASGLGDGEAREEAAQVQVIRDETGIESSRRMRDAILANVSHEFRTPLAAQLASIELLRDRLPELGSDETRELVLSIERGTVRLTQLIDNLLESVRIEAGQDSIRRQPVALDEVVEEAADMAAPLFAQREQVLEVDLPYPLHPVQGDRERLLQVFLNLLGNANKFSPAGSTIRVGGQHGENAITLWVEDEGPGVAAQETEAIFDRFTRSTGEEPAESGMGLGLWIVKSIVERHGGRVRVGDGASAGARLSITLPVESSA